MLVPPPNGISTASASSAARRTAATSASSAGPHDGVGQPAELAAALADEVAQALAARVHDAVVADRSRPSRAALERGAQRGGQRRLGDVQPLERRRGRAGARDVEAELLRAGTARAPACPRA